MKRYRDNARVKERLAAWMTGALLLTAVTIPLAVSQPAHAQDNEQAGVSAAVKGEVLLARGNAVGQQVESGEPIFLGDAITSSPASNLQIILMDESVFTIGPASEVTIDRFVYDPATQAGELSASLAKGVMRFVTGNIAAGQPENMTINLPVGTIGIRGTIGVIQVLDEERARATFPEQYQRMTGAGGGQNGPQPVVFAALAGPGGNNDANANVGAFNFSSPNGSVDLNRPGGAVLATPGAPPVFFIAPPGAVQNVTRQISGGATGTGEGQYDQGEETQDGADSGVDTSQVESSGASSPISTSQVVDELDASTQLAEESTDTVDSSGLTNAGSSVGVTMQELIAANSGEFSGSANITGTITGSLSYLLDFADRTFDFQTTSLNGGGLSSASINVAGGGAPMPNDTRRALTIGNNGEDFAASTSGCDNCSLSVTFPSTGSFDATVTHAGNSGSTGDVDF